MKKAFAIVASLMLAMGLKAQTVNDPVVMEIGGEHIHQSEFMKAFLESQGIKADAPKTACTYEKRKALEEYVDLYANFRAKLADAYAMGLDTARGLKKELNVYRTELAAPYLIDSATLQEILAEAYFRNQYAVNAAHILVKVKANPTPADTLEAYKKIQAIYKRALNGEDFNNLAREVSEDPSAKDGKDLENPRKGNGGELGYFTVFDMIYPFENTAYSLKEGEISAPIRTKFGYHIVKLNKKVPYYGKTTFQHIWISEREGAERAEYLAKEAYNLIQEGKDFSLVAKDYSQDKSTSLNGGLLNEVALRQMPTEYVDVISGMNANEISKPFKTSYGWHILKMVRKDQIPPMADMIPYYKQRLARDQRNTKPQSIFINDSKSRYGVTDYTTMLVPPAKKGQKSKTYMASYAEIRAQFNDSLLDKHWKFYPEKVTDLRPLIKVGDATYNNIDFGKYIQDNQQLIWKCDFDEHIKVLYDQFIDGMVLKYADSQLEKEHSEFRDLISDYRNGLVIFAYNDKMIWSKALADTIGMQNFYNEESSKRSFDNEDDQVYFWDERAYITVYEIADSTSLAPAKAMKIMAKAIKKGMSQEETQTALGKKMKDANIIIKNIVKEKGHQSTLTSNEWRKGVYCHPTTKGYELLVVENIKDPCLKSLLEARGYYISDYQNHLEKELIESLREKYHVRIHQDVVDEITY